MLGNSKAVAGIAGQDSGTSIKIDGTVYWPFGDTRLADGAIIPNMLGMSADKDASDCIDLAPRLIDGRPVPLLQHDKSSEISVWPYGLEETSPGEVDFYYISVEAGQPDGWHALGVGVASLDMATLTAQRDLDGALVWPEGTPWPTTTFTHQGYVYVVLKTIVDFWTSDVRLARVPMDSVASPSSYEYWDAGSNGEPGRWVTGLWDEETGTWDAAMNELHPLWAQGGHHNGAEIEYNDFLGRWLAVYSSEFFTSVSVRAADEPTGPWDAAETTLVNCGSFHPPAVTHFQCYSGTQHPAYTADGGRTIYISYANSDVYNVFLHEIRLAARMTQWSDGSGRAMYLPQGSVAPEGFAADGVAFYASDIPVPGFAPIHRWEHEQSGQARYSSTAPEPETDYDDVGVAFYAPLDAATTGDLNTPYVPVYRWEREGSERYSSLDLSRAGYARQEIAFYAPCPDSDGDSLNDCGESFLGTNPLVMDTDRDGCADALELGELPQFGGGRNPTNFWDFFDTPDRNGYRDRTTSAADLAKVLLRYGSRGDPTGDPLAGPIPAAPGYHTAFDRSGAADGERIRAADGTIGASDIAVVLRDFGTSCRATTPPSG
jgi:hypothetical protein